MVRPTYFQAVGKHSHEKLQNPVFFTASKLPVNSDNNGSRAGGRVFATVIGGRLPIPGVGDSEVDAMEQPFVICDTLMIDLHERQ